jgi:uncharacterized protein
LAETLALTLFVAAAGLAGGLLAGLLGVGGGIVVVPALDIAYGIAGIPAEVRMHLAVGTSLATIVPTSISSARAHRAHGAVDERVSRLWAPPMTLGAVAGAGLAAIAPGQLLAGVFAFVAMAAAAKMLLPLDGVRLRAEVPASRLAGMLPAAIGLVSALMGIGGGTLSVPALGLLGVPVHRAVGTSAWLGFWIALPAAIGYAVLGWERPGLPPWSVGYVSLVSMALLLPIMWLAAPWGAWLAHRLSHRALRRVFGLFLMIVAVRMAWRAWS